MHDASFWGKVEILYILCILFPIQILLLTAYLYYTHSCQAHLLDYDYYPGVDPGLLPPPSVGEQLLPVPPPAHGPHGHHSHHKRQTAEDIEDTPDAMERSSNDESGLNNNDGTGVKTADLYSGNSGVYPPYLLSQNNYNPLYQNPALLDQTGQGRPFYGSRYPYWGYSSLYRNRNLFGYPRYPFRYG